MRIALFGCIVLLLVGGMTLQDEEERRGSRGRGMVEMLQQMKSAPAPTMLVHKDHIFVAIGNKLIKVDPEAMKIVGEVELMKAPKKGSGRTRPERRRPRDEDDE